MKNIYAVCNICGSEIVYPGTVYDMDESCLCSACNGFSMSVITARENFDKTEMIVGKEITKICDDNSVSLNHLYF